MILGLNLDVVLALMGLVVAVVLVSYSTLILQREVYIVFGLLLAATCSSWLLLRKGNKADGAFFDHNRTAVHTLGIIFFIVFLFTILVFYLRPEPYSRPLIFFILVAMMAGIVSLEVLLLPLKRSYLILIITQVLIVGFSIQFSQILMFPDVIGIDPAIHQNLVTGIISNGYITPGFDYSTTPLFQLSIAASSLLFGQEYAVSAALFVSVSEIVLAPLSVLLIGRFLFNVRVGLMASLLLSVAPYHIFFGIWAVPNTIAILAIPLIIYLLLKLRRERGLTSLVLSAFLMFALVLTHPLAALGLAVILLAVWFIGSFYRSLASRRTSSTVTLGLALFFLTLMLGWWAYVGNQIGYISSAIAGGFQIEYLGGVPEVVSTFVFNIPLTEQVLRYFGMFLFFLLSLIGCFYIVTKKLRDLNRFTFAIVGLLMFGIGFFSLAFALTGLDARWFYLAEVFLAVPIAIFFISLYANIRPKAIAAIVVVLMVSSFAFFSTISPSGSIDNRDLFPNTGVRFAFTDSELAGAAFFAERSEGVISSDFDFATDVSSSVFINYHRMDVSQVSALDYELLYQNFSRDGSLKIIRSEAAEGPVRIFALPYNLGYDPRPLLSHSEFNKIYASGGITVYI